MTYSAEPSPPNLPTGASTLSPVGAFGHDHPSAYLRDLLLSAHLSIGERVALTPMALEAGRISITPASPEHPELVIRDNGGGLMPGTLLSLLAALNEAPAQAADASAGTDPSASAGPSTAALPGSLAPLASGLRAAGTVAQHIVVETRPLNGPASRLSGPAGGPYAISPLVTADVHEVPVGTTVRLTPRPAATQLAAYPHLWAQAVRYGEFLPVTLEVVGPRGSDRYVNRNPPFTQLLTSRVSGGLATWESTARREAAPDDFAELAQFSDAADLEHVLAYGAEIGGEAPLAAIAFECATTGTRGTAFVRATAPAPAPAPEPGPGQAITARVYVDGVLATEHASALVPDWAPFVDLACESTGLTPSARAGDLVNRVGDLVHDAALAATRAEIDAALRSWIIGTAHEDPAGMDILISRHGPNLHALAARDRAVRTALSHAPITGG